MAFVLSAAGRLIGSSSGTKVTAKAEFAFYLTAARWESEFVSVIRKIARFGGTCARVNAA